MAIDLENERLIPLRDASKHTPGNPHISAFYRWMRRAVNPLETILVGGRRWTSVEAIHRFIERGTNPDQPAPPKKMSKQQAARSEKAARYLEAHGV